MQLIPPQLAESTQRKIDTCHVCGLSTLSNAEYIVFLNCTIIFSPYSMGYIQSGIRVIKQQHVVQP